MIKVVFKLVFVALFIPSFLTSCVKYQHVSIVSDTYSPIVNENIIETDSLIIRYAFSGLSCPIQINVFNNIDQPIYIDWSKSAIILNGRRQTYWNDVSTINATTRTTEIQWTDDLSTSRGTTTGIIVKNERISFIPPKSGIVYSPMNLVGDWMDLPNATEFKKGEVATETGTLRGLFYEYERQNSPLEFRSFLTLSSNEQFTNPKYFDNAFWVNEIVETQAEPAILLNRYSNNFYNSKLTGFGGFLAGIAGGLLLIIAAVE